MRVIFILLTAFILSDEIRDIFFYVIEMTVLLYSLYCVYYTRVAVFFRVIMPLNTISHLFSRYMKFSF